MKHFRSFSELSRLNRRTNTIGSYRPTDRARPCEGIAPAGGYFHAGRRRPSWRRSPGRRSGFSMRSARELPGPGLSRERPTCGRRRPRESVVSLSSRRRPSGHRNSFTLPWAGASLVIVPATLAAGRLPTRRDHGGPSGERLRPARGSDHRSDRGRSWCVRRPRGRLRPGADQYRRFAADWTFIALPTLSGLSRAKWAHDPLPSRELLLRRFANDNDLNEQADAGEGKPTSAGMPHRGASCRRARRATVLLPWRTIPIASRRPASSGARAAGSPATVEVERRPLSVYAEALQRSGAGFGATGCGQCGGPQDAGRAGGRRRHPLGRRRRIGGRGHRAVAERPDRAAQQPRLQTMRSRGCRL